MSHSLDISSSDPNVVFSRPSVPPTGSDGMTMRTSVCADIEESVIKAAKIEKQIQDSKVKGRQGFVAFTAHNFFFFI